MGKSLYHRREKYASNVEEREDEEETRFARDRFSLSTGGDSDGGSRSRADAREENLERSWVAGRRTGMPVNVVNRMPRNLCVIYGDLRRAV